MLSAGAHYQLARALSWWGFPASAERAFGDALRLDPRLAEAHFHLGEMLAAQERWDEAADCLAAAARLRPDSAETHGNLVLALGRAGRWMDAISALRRLIALFPGQAELRVLEAALFRRARKPAESIRALRAAALLDLAPPTARFRLGEVLVGNRVWTLALDAFRALRTVAPPAESPAGNRSRLHADPRTGTAAARMPEPSLLARLRRRVDGERARLTAALRRAQGQDESGTAIRRAYRGVSDARTMPATVGVRRRGRA